MENRWIGENIFTSGGEHETRFAYDGNQIVLEFDKDVVDNNATVGVADLTHRYVWQPGAVDQLMADEQVTTAKVVWTLGDNQGTIRDLAVTESGVTSVATHRVFDSYGNLVSSVNPSTGEAAAVDCLIGFVGLPYDKGSQTDRAVNRGYDPSTGRWLSVDPSGFDGGDANTYRYVGNSPTNATDPSGLDRRLVIWWGHLLIEVSDPDLGTVYLEFNPRGFVQNLPYGWIGPVPTGAVPGPWYPSTPKQDKELIELWDQLEAACQKGDIPSYWQDLNVLWNCWAPALMFVDYPNVPSPKLDNPYELGQRCGSWSVCFREGTQVHTERGLQKIETISVGTKVWAYDHDRRLWSLMPVIDTEAHDFDGAMATLKVGKDTIEATTTHPFWVVSGDALETRPVPRIREGDNRPSNGDGRWVAAGDLQCGDTLMARDGRLMTIASIDTTKESPHTQPDGRSPQ